MRLPRVPEECPQVGGLLLRGGRGMRPARVCPGSARLWPLQAPIAAPAGCLPPLIRLQGVVGLISRCMALEPSERPTAQQVMQSLQALQQPDARDQANAGSTGVSSPAMPAES